MNGGGVTTAPVDNASLYKHAEIKMDSAFSNLEKGNFQNGLDDIEETIRVLCTSLRLASIRTDRLTFCRPNVKPDFSSTRIENVCFV